MLFTKTTGMILKSTMVPNGWNQPEINSLDVISQVFFKKCPAFPFPEIGSISMISQFHDFLPNFIIWHNCARPPEWFWKASVESTMVFRQSFDISFALDRVLYGAKIQQVTIMEIWALLTSHDLTFWEGKRRFMFFVSSHQFAIIKRFC